MAKYHLGCGRLSGYSPGTIYTPICGPTGVTFEALVEANHQIRIRFAATLENLFVRMTNSVDGASTIRSRVNGANGNLSVAIPALATGDFEDTVNSDSLLTGDLINTQCVMGGMSTWSAQVVAYTLDNTDDDRGIMVADVGSAADVSAPLNGATTYYLPIAGQIRSIARPEAGEDYIFRHATTFSQLRVFVDTNDPTGATTVRLRVNGADGNLNLSVPGSTTGEFEDTVNTDVIAIGDRVVHRVVTGSGGHGSPEVIVTVIQMHHDAPEIRVSAAGQSDGFEAQAGPVFLPIEAGGNWTTALASIDFAFPARFAFNVRNYYLNMRSNAYDVASVFTVREGVADVDTALTITVPALTSGRFEDTVNTVAVLVGDRISNEWDAPGRTAGFAYLTNIGMEIYLPGAEVDTNVSIGAALSLPWDVSARIGVTLEVPPPAAGAGKGIIGSGFITRRTASW